MTSHPQPGETNRSTQPGSRPELTRDDRDTPARSGPVVTTRWSAAARAIALVIAAVLAIDGLRFAKPVLLPLIAGIFLAILARPLHVRVRDALPRGLRWLGLVVAMVAILIGVGAFAGALGLAGRAVAMEFSGRRPQIESQIGRVLSRVERAGIPVPRQLQRGPSSAPTARQGSDTSAASGRRETAPGQSDASAAPADAGGSDLPTRILRGIATGLGGLALALGFAALGLAEAGQIRRRIAHVGRNGGQRAIEAIDEAAKAFRRYVWVKSLTSAITGVVTWLAALAFGLPLAWVWGFLAFLLEYVPSVGSLLAVLPPTLMALAEDGPARAAMVLVTIGTLQIVLGNVVDPRLEGRLMAISPFGVLLSIVFWGWLWGAVGALLAVPLTVSIVIACRHIPSARGVATIVAGDGVPDKD